MRRSLVVGLLCELARATSTCASSPADCTNPLFAARLPSAPGDELCKLPRGRRTSDLVCFAIIGGVPNQLLPADGRAASVDWTKILGKDPSRYDETGIDPFDLYERKNGDAPVPCLVLATLPGPGPQSECTKLGLGLPRPDVLARARVDRRALPAPVHPGRRSVSEVTVYVDVGMRPAGWQRRWQVPTELTACSRPLLPASLPAARVRELAE